MAVVHFVVALGRLVSPGFTSSNSEGKESSVHFSWPLRAATDYYNLLQYMNFGLLANVWIHQVVNIGCKSVLNTLC